MSDRVNMQGQYTHSIDAKKRLAIPAKFRDQLNTDFVVTRSLRDKCLEVYPRAEWDAYLSSFSMLPDKDRIPIERYLNRCAVSDNFDSQGRILLNDTLIAHAGLEKDVVVMGAGTRLEIWADTAYEEQIVNNEEEARHAAVAYLDSLQQRNAER